MNAQAAAKPCPVCKAPMEESLQDYVVTLEEGEEVIVEDVPMWLCEQCGYTEVEEEVIATVEDMLDHMEMVIHDATGEEE